MEHGLDGVQTVTPPVDDPDALRQILANTEALLLDFDGPICSVFAGIPAPVVAEQLRNVLAEGGHHSLPIGVIDSSDPFDILLYAAQLGGDEARYVEAALQAHEVEAIASADPNPGSVELIHAWKAAGRKLAIVSNNGVAAVQAYLDLCALSSDVDVISARSSYDVSLLKPSPHLVLGAIAKLEVEAERCVLVGDSVTDIEAAQAAGVNAISYANKGGKRTLLEMADPVAIVTSLDYVTASI